MLGSVFGFSGRLSRLQYFLTAVAVGFVAVVAVVAAMVLTAHAAPGAKPDIRPALPFLAPVGVAYLWIALSLQACRVRDIGWNPVYVLPILIVGLGVVQLLGKLVPPLHLLAGLANLALGGVLLFWPGAPEDGAAPKSGDRSGKAPPPLRAAPAMATPAGAAPTGFGRRGI